VDSKWIGLKVDWNRVDLVCDAVALLIHAHFPCLATRLAKWSEVAKVHCIKGELDSKLIKSGFD